MFARKSSAKGNASKSFLVDLGNGKIFDLGIENTVHQHLTVNFQSKFVACTTVDTPLFQFLPWQNIRECDTKIEHLMFYVEKRQLGILHIVSMEVKPGVC